MKILEYHCQDPDGQGWDFDRVRFGNVNLLVGDTATGKTRLLNTIFNLGRFVAAKEFKNGRWEIVFEHRGITYTWNLQTHRQSDSDESEIIIQEQLFKHEHETRVPLIQRDDTSFVFDGKLMPKLSPRETSISLLQEEEVIRPLYQAFSRIQRRLFSQDALSNVSSFQVVPQPIVSQVKKQRDLERLFRAEMNLSANLFVLFQYFKKVYQDIIDYYLQVFPFIQEARIAELSELQPNIAVPGHCPVFTIRERGSNKWVPINEFSSGMQKVLLILTDVFILPEGGVYIIDEYENSLGLNAIDFFPQFILDLEKDIQFFITSHHPYIINAIPPNNWFVFHRHGMKVSIRYGEELIDRFGKSRQKAFVQLINDPFFAKGVE